MTEDQGVTVALEALAWLLADEELLMVFLGSTGGSVGDLKSDAENPEFLGAVLDFILMDDQWITAFCDSGGHAYDLPAKARVALPGGDQVHWT